MSGIINYFHGERAAVADRWWQLVDDRLALRIELASNPHRARAQDYNSDIGIDPRLEVGDTAVYVRMEDTTGIWVREDHQHGTALREAVSHVLENRRWMRSWGLHSDD